MEQEISKEMIGLYGAIGGAVLTLIGTIISQVLTVIKDYQVAKSNREDKKSEREFERGSREKVELVVTFQKCLSSLGVFIQKVSSTPNKEPSYFQEEITAVQNSISELAVKFIDKELENDLISFIQFPSEDHAIYLRGRITTIIENNSEIGAKVLSSAKDNDQQDQTGFSVLISSAYRQKHFELTGVMLEGRTIFSYKPEALSPEVRKLLVKVYFFGTEFKLRNLQPLYVPGGPNIKIAKTAWHADFNPDDKDAEFIFNEWMNEYRRVEASYTSK